MEPTSFQKVSQRIKEHGVAYKLEELCLDEIKLVLFTQKISILVEKCQRLEHLSLCNCQLSSLIYFPMLSNLSKLELSHNNLESEHLEPLVKFSRLYQLSLDFNLIKDFGWTRFLKRIRLAKITLQGNPIAQEGQYREKVYKGLGADLQMLDGIDRQGNIIEQSQSSEEMDEQDESGQAGESDEEGNSNQSEEIQDSINKKMKIQEQKQQN